MNCKWFDKYDRGKITAESFQAHAKKCLVCQEKVRRDEELLSLSRNLRKKRVDAPFLWTRIEQDLRETQRQSKNRGWRITSWFSWIIIPVSVVLFLAICMGLFLWFRPSLHDSTLLADSALRRIEKREFRYEKSIEKLQDRVLPKLVDLGWDLSLLYRDRLETIDEQINACKEALQENPGNTHIRQYMLAAFQDKKSMLKEIMGTRGELLQGENFQ